MHMSHEESTKLYLSTIPGKLLVVSMVMQVCDKIQPHNKNLHLEQEPSADPITKNKYYSSNS